MQKYQSWFNSDDDQDLKHVSSRNTEGFNGGRASAAVHVGKRCLYYFLVMMILNYSGKTNYFDREKIRFAVNNQFHFHCQVVWPFVEKCDCPRAEHSKV